MADNWQKTAELFSKLIEKPKMAEKFLKKPPPRYVYDIIINTMKVTGFPKGLLTDEEETADYFNKDTKNKQVIIQKVIDITKIVLNEQLDIKCANILRGSEPEKTNVFLQMFHKAATSGKDFSEFIRKYLQQKKKSEERSKEKEQPAKEENKPIDRNPPEERPKKTANPAAARPDGNKKPKGIISENDNNFDQEMEKAEDIGAGTKLKKGTGMKLDTRIFMHGDIMGDKKDSRQVQVSNVDLDVIKAHVQEITKNSNPIGKIVEFIGDDIDLMNKELQNWIKESKSYKDRYDEEIKKSDETLLPLQNELLELEDSIRDEQMQIKSIKSRLIKNEKIIYNLITNVISFKGEGN